MLKIYHYSLEDGVSDAYVPFFDGDDDKRFGVARFMRDYLCAILPIRTFAVSK